MYFVPDSKFPPTLWSSLPSLNAKRTTNGAESFHAHYNEQFNPTSTSPRWAGVTDINYQLTNFWLTEEVLL
jgi:hypothetical protein